MNKTSIFDTLDFPMWHEICLHFLDPLIVDSKSVSMGTLIFENKIQGNEWIGFDASVA